jgi:O-antigen/teichoic acid export membrane protein
VTNLPPLPPEEDPADGTALERERAQEQVRADRKFINNGSVFMIADNLSGALGPLLVLLCARLYAGGAWGFFKYYESILLLLTRLAAVGMDRGVVWIYSQRDGEHSFVRVFSRAMNFVMLFGVVLALLAGAHWLGWFPGWSGFAHDAPGATGFNITCYLASIPFQAGTLLLLQALLNKRRLLPQALVRNILVPLATLGPAAVLAFTPMRAYGLAVPYLFGSLLGFGVSLFYFMRAFPSSRKDWSGSAKVPRDMIRFSLPLASTDFAMSMAYRMDILLLGRFVGLQAVEVYSVIVMIANTLKSVRQSFDGIMLSVFSKGKSRTPKPEQIRHFNYANWMVLSLQLPFLPLALLFGRELLGVVSPLYAAGALILPLVIFFNLSSTLGAFSGQFVTGMGRTWIIPVSQASFFTVSLGLNLLLVPRFGMAGAAVATGLAGVTGALVSTIGVWRLNGRSPFLAPYLARSGMQILLLAPAMALGLAGATSLVTRISVLVLCLGAFYWITRAGWRKFNAVA